MADRLTQTTNQTNTTPVRKSGDRLSASYTPPKPTVATPTLPKPSASQAFTREAALNVAPSTAGIVAGTKSGAMAGRAAGPYGAIAGAILGGGAAALGVNSLQDLVLPKIIGEENADRIAQKRAQSMIDNPIAARAGQFASGIPILGPSIKNTIEAGTFLKTLMKKPKDEVRTLTATPAGRVAIDNAINVAAGGAVQAGTEAYGQMQDGEFNPGAIAANFAAGSLMNKPTALGRKLGVKNSVESDYGRTLPVQSQTPESRSVPLTRPTQVPVRSQTPEATTIPVSTPNTRQRAYAESQGYEPYTPDSQLPTIRMGERPKTDGVQIDELEPPKVAYDDINERMSKLTPEDRQKVITDTRRLFGKGEDWNDARFKALDNFERNQAGPITISKPPVTPSPRPPAIRREPNTPPTPVATPTATRRIPITSSRVSDTPTALNKPTPATPAKAVDEKRVSRHAARMRGMLDNIPKANIEEFAEKYDLPTYSKINLKDQAERAARYIEENGEEKALELFRKGQDTPDGVHSTALGMALETRALDGDNYNMVETLSSLRGTRAGQDISLYKLADPDSPVAVMEDIVSDKVKAAARRIPKSEKAGLTDEQAVNRKKKELVKDLKKKIESAEVSKAEIVAIINELGC